MNIWWISSRAGVRLVLLGVVAVLWATARPAHAQNSAWKPGTSNPGWRPSPKPASPPAAAEGSGQQSSSAPRRESPRDRRSRSRGRRLPYIRDRYLGLFDFPYGVGYVNSYNYSPLPFDPRQTDSYDDEPPRRQAEPQPPRRSTRGTPDDHGAELSSEGWVLLSVNRAAEAIDIFVEAAREQPRLGVPRLGYAVAVAMKGDLRLAALTMRQAFQIDPPALHHVPPLLPGTERAVKELITRCEFLDRSTSRNKDAAFMLAALHALLGDEKAAGEMLDRAVRYGDISGGVSGLRRALRETPPKSKKAPPAPPAGQTSPAGPTTRPAAPSSLAPQTPTPLTNTP
jgi:hypothetical protein